MTTHNDALRALTMQHVNPDMLAMMAYLRDIPLSTIGLHVAGRPDISGARLQAGIRFLFNRAINAVPGVVQAAPAPTKATRATRGSKASTSAPEGSVKAFVMALQRCMRAAMTGHCSIPTLACVRLTISGNVATLACTDMEMAITESFPCVAPDMDIITPAKPLLSALKLMASGTLLSLEATVPMHDGDHGTLVIGQSRFGRLDVSDFPSLVAGDFPTEFVMTAPELHRIFKAVQFAMSTEETRYYLNGVHINAKDGMLQAVTTDGHQLGHWTAKTLPAGAETLGDKGIIIPRAAIGELLALLAKETGNVRIRCSDSRIEFTLASGLCLLSKTIDGNFPEYQRVIPRAQDAKYRCTLDKAELVNACKHAKAIGEGHSVPVRLAFEDGACTANSVNTSTGTTMHDSVAIVGAPPEDLQVGYQARYLLDILAVTDGNPYLEMQDASCPCRITSVDTPELVIVLMPMRV